MTIRRPGSRLKERRRALDDLVHWQTLVASAQAGGSETGAVVRPHVVDERRQAVGQGGVLDLEHVLGVLLAASARG